MSGIRLRICRDAHPYTRSKVPWEVEGGLDGDGSAANSRLGWRLRNRACGRRVETGHFVREEERHIRQKRFLVFFAVLAAVWLLLIVC